MLTSGRTKSVQDAPTTNDHCCTDAMPSECPKGDRDNKSEVYFKNRLFLQSALPLGELFFINSLILLVPSLLSIDTKA